MQISLLGGSYRGISRATDPQRTVNLYLCRDYGGGRSALVRRSGLRLAMSLDRNVNNITDYPVRGLRVMGSSLYGVFGNMLLKLNAGFSVNNTTQTQTVYDVNGDGIFDQLDVTALFNYILTSGMTGAEMYVAHPTWDYNSDGTIDVDDVTALYQNLMNGSTLITTGDTLNTKSGPVTMHDNGEQLFICDGTWGYIYDSTDSTFVVLTESDHGFLGGKSATWISGYFVSPQPNTSLFLMSSSETLNGKVWDPLDTFSVEKKPGNLLRVIGQGGELVCFKEHSVQFFAVTTTGSPVFANRPGAEIDTGLGAEASAAELDNTIYWFADDCTVRKISNYQAVVVSTPEISHQFQGYATTSDAVGFGYTDEGRMFYVLTFPAEKKTWVYEVGANLWVEYSSYSDGYPTEGQYRGCCYANFDGKHIVGDYQYPRLYEMDPDYHTDNDHAIPWERVTPIIFTPNKNMIFYPVVELECEHGTGLNVGSTTNGYDPEAILTWSDDGARTWCDQKRGSMGKVGEYGVRTRFTRCGGSRARCFRVQGGSPVKTVIWGLNAELEVGHS